MFSLKRRNNIKTSSSVEPENQLYQYQIPDAFKFEVYRQTYMRLAGPTWNHVHREQLVSELVSLYPHCFSEEDVYDYIRQDEDVQLCKEPNDDKFYLSRVVHLDFNVLRAYIQGKNIVKRAQRIYS